MLERAGRLGGAMTPVSEGGYTWDAGPTSMLLPAVVRDLFRKSGRPLEDELPPGLEPLDVVREHRFEDGTVLRLPGGSRARRWRPSRRSSPGLGAAWEAFTGRYEEVWEVLRRGYLEAPWDGEELAPREAAAILDSRETLHKRLRKTFRDDRPALVAGYPHEADGHDLRNVPAWAGLTSYLEQLFGTWTVPGGMHRLTAALADRLALRGVDRAARHRGARPRGAAGPGGRGAHRRRRGGRRRRRVRRRPAPAARAGALGRAHDAGAAAGGLPHRPRRRPRAARPAARAGAARRPRARGAHRRHRPRRLRGLDAARPRPARRGHAAGARPPPPRRPRPGRRPRRPLAARPRARSGAAHRTACPGPAAARCAPGSAPTPRCPASTPPAPTPPPAPASTRSASPPPSSPGDRPGRSVPASGAGSPRLPHRPGDGDGGRARPPHRAGGRPRGRRRGR